MNVVHELIRPDTLESRSYQEAIFSSAIDKNMLVVLPTGLGKTPIAVMLAAHRLSMYPESKILVLAPTKPLSDQHRVSFSKFLNLGQELFITVTGDTQPEKRRAIYETGKLFFATPQTIQNDMNSGLLDLSSFSLLVIDEIHRGVGKYPYPFIAQVYVNKAKNPRILGLTASPSSVYSTIKEICANAMIDDVQIKSELDPDVLPYVKHKVVETIQVDLPQSFLEVKSKLSLACEEKLETLRKMNIRLPGKPAKRQLLEIQKSLARQLSAKNKFAIIALSVLNQVIKIDHALTLLETQGIVSLENYFKKLREDEKGKRMLSNKHVSQAQFLTNTLFQRGATHPKMSKICQLVSEELSKNAEKKMIIFANYRDTVSQIVGLLSRIDGAKPVAFFGQRSGLTQKQQLSILQDFRDGAYNILVGTSVSEEGLDIPSMDTAIFYEPVPSEIRNIQRRGRVGRHDVGRVILLVTRNTRDQAYYWSARHKERKMKQILRSMQLSPSLDSYSETVSQPEENDKPL